MNVRPEATYEAVIDWGATGATIGMRVVDNAGATTVARVTGFTEYPAGSGVYYRGGNTAPDTAGQYTLVFDDDGGTAAVGHVATDDLIVAYSSLPDPLTGPTYATADELFVALNIRATPTQAQEARAESLLLAATGEINSEIGLTADDLTDEQLAIAEQVCIERAVEHWHARPVGFAVVGLDTETPVRLGSNSWERHANKLAPLKSGELGWGFA